MNVTATIVASEYVEAYAGITAQGKPADSRVLSQMGKVVGVTTRSIGRGFAGEVQLIGELVNPAWRWTAGDAVFINGTKLAATPPASGWVKKVGVAKNQTTIIVDLGEAILL